MFVAGGVIIVVAIDSDANADEITVVAIVAGIAVVGEPMAAEPMVAMEAAAAVTNSIPPGARATEPIAELAVAAVAAAVAAACGPPPNVDRNTFINVIMNMAITDILLTRSASNISVRFLTLNLN